MAKRTALMLACALLAAAGVAHAQKSKSTPALKAWEAEPATFFGIPLGAEIKLADFRKCGASSTAETNPEIKVCSKGKFSASIAISEFPIKELESGIVGLDGSTVSYVFAQLAHRDYPAIRSMLVERYGTPTKKENGTVQNAMGAVFSNENLLWVGKRVTLTLEERDGKIDQSALTILHHTTVDKSIQSDEQKRRSEASKF